jgi:uncharacterized HAD superfamily protein
MSKVLVLSDCDGVLAHTPKAVERFHSKRYGAEYDLRELAKHGKIHPWQENPTEENRRWDEFYQSQEFREILPIEGALEGIDSIRLLNEGYEVSVLTARPTQLQESTLRWIHTHFQNRFRDVVFSVPYINCPNPVAENKAKLCLRLGARYIIEDTPENAVECAKVGISAIVLDQPWNQNYYLPPEVRRARNWEEVVELIRSVSNK